MDCGADDAGAVLIDRPELDDQRDDVLKFAPWTKTLVSIVCKMNREPLRSPARSLANLEFEATGHHTNEVSRRVVRELESRGIRCVNPAMGFPMEIDNFPGKVWAVSHKPVAVAAGLGQMGIHRNVIHPKFGNFILLATILLDTDIDEQSQQIEYNPCLDCKLCVAACPVGAISPNGDFDFSACYTHNYREFMGGFTDWIETIVGSRSRNAYRKQVTDGETASWWQSLSFGANYKSAYCLSACPAGEDVITPFLDDRKQFVRENVAPLQEKGENLYVIRGSDAAEKAAKRFPHKPLRYVRGSINTQTIHDFLRYAKHIFQPGQAKGITATYHFVFSGSENRKATLRIADQQFSVEEGLVGKANLKIYADSKTWLRFLSREKSLAWALLTLKIRLVGSPFWLLKFGRCFPS